MLNGNVTITGYLSVLMLYLIFSFLKFIFQSFSIRSQQNGDDLGAGSPTVLGKLFLGNPPTPRVLPFHLRYAYIVAKSIEAFFISVSPCYSLEKLEKGLQRDGIVRNGPRPNGEATG
ncbi:unnamed protein product, partial [Phytomonas sp. Hart1]